MVDTECILRAMKNVTPREAAKLMNKPDQPNLWRWLYRNMDKFTTVKKSHKLLVWDDEKGELVKADPKK